MDSIHQAVARARTRLTLNLALNWAGILLLAGLCLAAVVVLVADVFAVTAPMWSYAIPFGMIVVAAVVIAFMRMPGKAHAAALADERLKLKDRLGTSLYCENLQDNPFAKQVVAEARDVASQTRVDQAFPIRLGRAWQFVPVGIVLLTGAILLSEFVLDDPFGFQKKREQIAQEKETIEATQRQIEEVMASMQEADIEPSKLSDADPTELMNELVSLSRQRKLSPEGKREALSKLAALQSEIELQAEIKEQEFKSMQASMSRLDPQERGPADDFADALRRGDFEQAMKELQEMEEQIKNGDMSEQEKEQLQKQLNNMAQQLQNMAQQAQQRQQQAQQNMQQQMQNAGMSQQQAQQLAKQFSQGGQSQQQMQQQIQQALQQSGQSQQQAQQNAQKLSQQMKQQSQQAQQSGQCSQCQGGLGQSMSQMAQSLGQQGQQGQQGSRQSQQSQFSQGSFGAQQQLGQMARMQHQMQQAQQAQQQAQQAMQQMAGQQQGQQGQGGQQGQQGGQQMTQQGQQGQGGQGQQNQGGGVGGLQPGTAEGGDPLGVEHQIGPYNVTSKQDIQQREGRIIASWMENGEMAAGDPTVSFDTAVSEARDQAERAVAEDRVPKRYHGAVKDYFNQLPQTQDEIRQAPAAPN